MWVCPLLAHVAAFLRGRTFLPSVWYSFVSIIACPECLVGVGCAFLSPEQSPKMEIANSSSTNGGRMGACALRLSTCSQQVQEKLHDRAIMVTMVKPTAIVAKWLFSDGGEAK